MGLGLSFAAKAQYVNIPDAAFRSFLIGKFPACFNGAQQLDTVCAASITSMQLGSSYPNASTVFSVEGLQYFKGLRQLVINNTSIHNLPPLPHNLIYANLGFNLLDTLPPLPATLLQLSVEVNRFYWLPALPNNLTVLACGYNYLTSIPSLPNSLVSLSVSSNVYINSLPALGSLTSLFCNNTSIQFLNLPSTLTILNCSNTSLDIMSNPLPPQLSYLNCSGMGLTFLPPLPNTLTTLLCHSNLISSLPAKLPPQLNQLNVEGTNITCLPILPQSLYYLSIDPAKIRCIPNSTSGLQVNGSSTYSLCSVTTNANGCIAFPTMQGNTFYDLNSNGVHDAGEYNKRNGKVNLSNGAYTFTNDSGFYQLGADTIGGFTVTPVAPHYFTAVPVNASYNFSTYDTTVTKDFALQPVSTHDSVNVVLSALNWRARPGFGFSYKVSYQNAGSTNLGATNVVLHYDGTKLTFNNASTAVTNAGNTLTLSLPALPVGDFGDFTANFTVKTTAQLGDTLTTDVAMTSGTNFSADTSRTVITGSFDPNDKDATPYLTPQQVVNGKYIDYTIRFQNTGTDTAIHVVVTDTLGSQLQANTLEMVSTSHLCKTTVKGNAVSFEMRNILLPDSNVNEAASHGFIRFRVKPVNTLTLGNTVPNKAAIYFDYNTPVITNTAITTIKDEGLFPLKLLAFRGRRTTEKTVQLYWLTSHEINTKTFIIQHSTEGRTFTAVGETKAVGYGNNSYTFTHNSLLTTHNYYRLKMVDLDGAFTYSTIIIIKNTESTKAFEIAANPVKTQLIVTGVNTSLFNSEATIVNSIGVVVKRFVLKTATQTIDVSALPAGLYVVHTSMGSEKVMIER